MPRANEYVRLPRLGTYGPRVQASTITYFPATLAEWEAQAEDAIDAVNLFRAIGDNDDDIMSSHMVVRTPRRDGVLETGERDGEHA